MALHMLIYFICNFFGPKPLLEKLLATLMLAIIVLCVFQGEFA